jgi:hypothetical protein
MRIANAILAISICSSFVACCAAQETPARQTPASTTSSAVPTAANTSPAASNSPSGAPAAPAPSSILQPSLDTVRQTLSGLRVERWKHGSVRDEASSDINSISADLQQRVPALLKDADAAPGSLSKTLPVSRHLDALYDVLLRVVEAARMAAPDDQANQLRNALENLEKARLALDDSMETIAGSQEKQLVDLRVTVQKQAAFKCPAPPPAPVCPKAEPKRPVRRKPAGQPVPSGGTAQKAPASGTSTQKTTGTPTQTKPAAGAQQKPAAAKPNPSTQQKPNPQ